MTTDTETKPKNFNIKIEAAITPERIADMMCTAIERNFMTQAWCAGVFITGAHKGQRQRWKTEEGYPWYCNPAFYADESFQIEVQEVIDEGKSWQDKKNIRRHICGRSEFEAGLQLMAEKYPDHFKDLMQENDDAITGDVFLQCIALKEVVYG